MRESNAIFPEIKYNVRKCLECDDIFTPAYRHPHQKFCKNPIRCRHRDARRKSLSHQRLMRNPAYCQSLSQRKSREYYHRKNLRTLRQTPEIISPSLHLYMCSSHSVSSLKSMQAQGQAPEIRPPNSGARAVVISSFFKSNALQATEQAMENSYTHSSFSVNVQCRAFSFLNLQIPGMLSDTVRSKTTSNSLFSHSKSSQAPEQAPEIPASGQESFERLELTMLGLIRLVTDIKASEELRELQERCYQFGKECFLPGIGRTGICTSLNSVSPHPG